jgi:hypothetical protein
MTCARASNDWAEGYAMVAAGVAGTVWRAPITGALLYMGIIRHTDHMKRSWFAWRRLRAGTAAAGAIAIVLGGFVGIAPAAAAASEVTAVTHDVLTADPVKTADLSKFNPGNIISDAVFFNSGTMSPADIQSFLNGKVPSCQSGYVCLKDFRQTTSSMASSNYCAGYAGAPNETAATIIYKVAVSCGINPQVLLVTLQKEQGLVTHTWPSEWRYTSAMGQGCPDTAACDTKYYGFQNQVYGAARQFKIYQEGRYFTYYAPGKTWNILYNPNSGCGTAPVYVENKATAGLYYYTPYQPNAAALRAGYGEGDGCSSYGNRNFYQYFTDWFGSTQAPSGAGAIAQAYAAAGGSSGYLGAALEGVKCGLVQAGCYQLFQGGQIHWTAASGAHATRGEFLAKWASLGYETSKLGYPTSEQECGLPADGCYQNFQNGKVYWSAASGTHPVWYGPLSTWAAQGYERGALGYPVEDERCGLVQGGCYQLFQGGQIHWSAASGAHATRGELLAKWSSLGYEAGKLGYPTSEQECGLPADGCYQNFQNGKMYWSAASGAHGVWYGILSTWASLGYERGSLGYPTEDEQCGLAGGGCSQRFDSGAIFWKPMLPAVPVLKLPGELYQRLGGVASKLGYPTSALECGLPNAGCYQNFENGKVYWSASSDAHAVWYGMLSTWAQSGYERGPLGYPLSEEQCDPTSATCTQTFQGGIITWSATGGSRPTLSP